VASACALTTSTSATGKNTSLLRDAPSGTSHCRHCLRPRRLFSRSPEPQCPNLVTRPVSQITPPPGCRSGGCNARLLAL
jgi:hypothetical protein